MDTGPESPAAPTRRARRQPSARIRTLGALAAIVSAVIAVLTYCQVGRTGGDGATPPVVPASGATLSSSAQASSEDLPSGEVVYLTSVAPDRGLTRVTELPAALHSQEGYDNALVISCPTNQTGDQMSEVVYEARNRYGTFAAILRPYRDPADDVRVELQVFSDPLDRDPGAPPPGDQGRFQLAMGQSEAISVTISDAYYLRLRVLCEKPGGYVILANASVTES